MQQRSNKKRIKDLPLSLRPREKLMKKGKENMTTAELLAILLSTGTTKKNALALSDSLLRKHPLVKMAETSVDVLAGFPGIGTAKAARIIAAVELGERIFAKPSMTKTLVRSTQDAVHLLKEYADKRQEYLIALYLNARHELLQKEILGLGTLNSMRIEPKEVFRPALTTPCASLIIAHNHPSGDPNPSDDDIAFTKRVFEAGEIMGVPMLDHLIITKRGYFSFRDNKQYI
jgi:DNA repair protein RadC